MPRGGALPTTLEPQSHLPNDAQGLGWSPVDAGRRWGNCARYATWGLRPRWCPRQWSRSNWRQTSPRHTTQRCSTMDEDW
eukprot:4837149-Amphidinium_carterae.1